MTGGPHGPWWPSGDMLTWKKLVCAHIGGCDTEQWVRVSTGPWVGQAGVSLRGFLGPAQAASRCPLSPCLKPTAWEPAPCPPPASPGPEGFGEHP